MSDNDDSNTEGDDETKQLKLIVTIVVLIAAFILSIVVAKLVDICYDRRAIRDDASDISENTRNLIRARLSVIKFKKREKLKNVDGEPEKTMKKSAIVDFFRKWAQKVRDRRNTREISIKSTSPSSGDGVVITVQRDDVTENCNNHHNPRSPRLPVFSGGKMPTSSQKIQNSLFATRPVSGKQSGTTPTFASTIGKSSVIALERSRPTSGRPTNDKTRPVSSKPRNLPNVTRVDIDNSPKVHVKSVHFDDKPSELCDSKATLEVEISIPKTVKPEVVTQEPVVVRQQPEPVKHPEQKVVIHQQSVVTLDDVET